MPDAAKMSDAAKIAAELSALFLRNGNYAFASSGQGSSVKGMVAAQSTSGSGIDSVFSDEGFHGLSVQSVGFSKGDAGPRVYIYLTKGRSRDKVVKLESGAIPVTFRRVGRMMINPDQASSATNQGKHFTYRNRVACGSSCAPTSESYSGTFGALVQKRGDRDNLFILSNNHVLAACNHTPVGMPILSPSSTDGGKLLIAPKEIGRHAEICILQSGDPAFVEPCREDLAIAAVTDPTKVTSWQGPSAKDGGYDTPTSIEEPAFDMKVRKVGRTTGLTRGIVEAKLTPFPLPYKAKYFGATVWFKETWSIRGIGGDFALPGDSGSLVVKDDDKSTAIGMIFAVSPYGETVIIPMSHVAKCFGGISLVGAHGV